MSGALTRPKAEYVCSGDHPAQKGRLDRVPDVNTTFNLAVQAADRDNLLYCHADPSAVASEGEPIRSTDVYGAAADDVRSAPTVGAKILAAKPANLREPEVLANCCLKC